MITSKKIKAYCLFILCLKGIQQKEDVTNSYLLILTFAVPLHDLTVRQTVWISLIWLKLFKAFCCVHQSLRTSFVNWNICTNWLALLLHSWNFIKCLHMYLSLGLKVGNSNELEREKEEERLFVLGSVKQWSKKPSNWDLQICGMSITALFIASS